MSVESTQKSPDPEGSSSVRRGARPGGGRDRAAASRGGPSG